MTNSWPSRKIGELGRVVTGKTPLTSDARNFGGEFPFVTIPDMVGRRDITSSARTLSNQGAQALRSCQLPKGAVMMSCIATIGRCGITTRPSFTNQQINSLICDEGIDPKYVYYCFTQLRQALEIAGGGGSIYTNVSKSRFEGIEIPVPPIAEQKCISGILSAFDDKIELNRKMNATLEQMAKAMFKSWFVDFDPVHAKAAGRQPAGMDKATADLFPDSLVDSELGKIPSGWEAGALSSLSEFSRESINPGESPSEIFDHYSLPSFDEGKAPKAEAGSEIKSNKLVVTKTCVLLSKLNPHIPRIWLPNLNASRRSICSTEFIVASAMAGCTREYLYALFISEDFSRTYGTLVTGTTGSHQRIRAESVLQMRLPIAPTKLISSFTDTITPILNQVASNTKESQTLAELRDTLLPQLLNGDLKVA
jgi:type I restriction enzyme S subunit